MTVLQQSPGTKRINGHGVPAVAADILHGLRERGFVVFAMGSRVEVHPECMAKPADLKTVQAHAHELLAFLQAEDQAKGEDRPLWVLMPAGYKPAAIQVDSLAKAPVESTHWMRSGDNVWKPLSQRRPT